MNIFTKSEYQKYQRIKNTILYVAWKEIEHSPHYSTSLDEIRKSLNEQGKNLNLSYSQFKKLLDEITIEDKWLKFETGRYEKINKGRFEITPKGRRQIDVILQGKFSKNISQLKAIILYLAKILIGKIMKS